ncbi:MAG: MotA/TolQ/ExbB proton channel family protein [Burkholderiaceae bacterium]
MTLDHMIESADGVIIAVALVLVVMSVLSWAAIGARLIYGWQRLQQRPAAPEAFWAETDRERAERLIAESYRSRLLLRLVHRAQAAASAMGGTLNDRLVRQLRDELLLIRNDLSSGLGLLASIGSTAPFVGLLGTVWSIFRALTSIQGQGQVMIDQVSGPVGEALVMTAAGLFVAIPAVLAYNAFQRLSQKHMAGIEAFADDLLQHPAFSSEKS